MFPDPGRPCGIWFCSIAMAKPQSALTPNIRLQCIFKQLLKITHRYVGRKRDYGSEAMARVFAFAGFPAEDIHLDGPRRTERTLSYACAARRGETVLFSHLDVV